MAHLEIFTGCHAGQYIDLDEELRLGRDSDNDFALSDPLTSRYHARITRCGEHFVIEDLTSRNGTSVRGARIPAATPCRLNDRDEIEIGTTRMIFYLHDGLGAQKEPKWHNAWREGGRSVPEGQIQQGQTKTLPLLLIEEDAPGLLILSTIDVCIGVPDTDESGGDAELQQAYRRLWAIHQINVTLGTITDLNVLMPKLLDSVVENGPNEQITL